MSAEDQRTIAVFDISRIREILSTPGSPPEARMDAVRERLGCLEGAREIERMKRDHVAMEALRFASLKQGWKWSWDGIDLTQVAAMPSETDYYKDPADAILGEAPAQEKMS